MLFLHYIFRYYCSIFFFFFSLAIYYGPAPGITYDYLCFGDLCFSDEHSFHFVHATYKHIDEQGLAFVSGDFLFDTMYFLRSSQFYVRIKVSA